MRANNLWNTLDTLIYKNMGISSPNRTVPSEEKTSEEGECVDQLHLQIHFDSIH